MAAGLVGHKRLEVFLGIAAGQVEQSDAAEVGHVVLRVEEPDVGEAVDVLLIDEGERLPVSGYQRVSSFFHAMFPSISCTNFWLSGSTE